MAASLLGGAAVGAAFGELLKAVLDMKDKAVLFKSTLASLGNTLTAIDPVIEQMKQHNNDLGRPQEELGRLIKQMEQGKELVCDCSKIGKWDVIAKYRKQKELEKLADSLLRFFMVEMQAQTARDQKETLLKVGRILSSVNRLCLTCSKGMTFSSPNLASVPMDVFEVEIPHPRATQPAKKAERVKEHGDQVTTASFCDSDTVPVHASESNTLHSTASRPDENSTGTNSPEPVMEHISQVTRGSSWGYAPATVDVSKSKALHLTPSQPAEKSIATNSAEQDVEQISQVTRGSSWGYDPVPVDLSESKTVHSTPSQPAENSIATNSAERVMEHVSQVTRGSSCDSDTVHIYVSESKTFHSTASQPDENSIGINSPEQVMEHISQVTRGLSCDSDDLPMYVSESTTLPSMATQPTANVAETNSAEKVMELITSLTQEVGQFLERDQIMNKFHEVTAKLKQEMGEISFDKLDIPDEVKEQVECVLDQFRIADITQESLALPEMVAARDGDLWASIEKMSKLLQKKNDYVETENLDVHDNVGGKGLSSSCSKEGINEKSQQPPVVPVDFRCPISLELMTDPVIVSTGQTYERSCIEKWFEAGHRTCPKTQKTLYSTALTPNFALRSLIADWCEANGVEPSLKQPNSSQSSKSISACSLAERSWIENLLQKLTSGSPEDQRSAAGEIHLLTNLNEDSRVAIAEAGAIPLLVGLLSASDSRIQVHAVTALLNLSICENNKGSIISSGAVPGIVHVLEKGSMEARENAAITLRSLSTIDENKVTIGSSGAIPPLVTLLSEGTERGKKDAAATLYDLCFYEGNKAKAVKANVVPTIMQLVTSGGMVEVAWSILTILASHPVGKAAIGNSLPILLEVIGNGSPVNKENAAATLVQLCSGDQQYLAQAQELGAMDPLSKLAQNGTKRGKRKAKQLLRSMVN